MKCPACLGTRWQSSEYMDRFPCPDCDTTGVAHGDVECPACKGDPDNYADVWGEPCGNCEGRGEVWGVLPDGEDGQRDKGEEDE